MGKNFAAHIMCTCGENSSVYLSPSESKEVGADALQLGPLAFPVISAYGRSTEDSTSQARPVILCEKREKVRGTAEVLGKGLHAITFCT